jgi:predicted ATPase
LSLFYNVSGKLQKSRELGEQLLELAEQDSDLSQLIVAHETLGHSLLYLGEFTPALTHEEKAIALSLSPQPRSPSLHAGYESGVVCYCFAALCRWCLGYPNQALHKSHEALRLTEQLDHPFTRAVALYYAAFIRRFRREWQATLDHTEPLLTLAAEHGFTHWRVRGLLLQGWALAEGGHVASGIAQMEQTLDEVRAKGLGVRIWMRAYLAEAYGKFGQPEKGLEILREVSTLPTEIEERRDESELNRLEGILLLSHSVDHQAEAEDSLVKALSCAQSQQAKSLELRAATSLSRLLE